MRPTSSLRAPLPKMARAPPLPVLHLLLAALFAPGGGALDFATVANVASAGRIMGRTVNNTFGNVHGITGSSPVTTLPSPPPPRPPPPPPAPTKQRASDKHQNHEYLDGHNSVRKYVGEEPLVWNATIAKIARRYLHSKRDSCDMGHSNLPDLGENIFWGEGKRWGPTDAVMMWAQEHFYYDAEKNECLKGRICGHYTQMIWRRSQQIGCARVDCTNGGILISCNYLPCGNYYGESPFDTDT